MAYDPKSAEARDSARKGKRHREKLLLSRIIEDRAKLAMGFADALDEPKKYHRGRRRFRDLSQEEQMQCVQDHFLCGSLRLVASSHNVIIQEMFNAAKQAWWVMEISALQRESVLMMKSRLDRIMNLTLEQLEDRVTNGDVQLDKEGESFRCPVNAQTLATVANVIFDKKLKLEDRASGFVEGENKRLIDLANSLTMMGAKAVEVIDADVIDDDATDDDATDDEGNENEITFENK